MLWESKVAGVSFEPHKSNLEALFAQIQRYGQIDLAGYFKVKLIHNDENIKDPNAIEVHVKGPTEAFYRKVGFVPKADNQFVLASDIVKLAAHLIKFNTYRGNLVGMQIGVSDKKVAQEKVNVSMVDKLTKTQRKITV